MRVGDVLQLEYGKPLDDARRSPNGRYPAYGANGVKARTDEYLIDRPSIVVGRKGSAGEVTLTEPYFWPLDVTYYVTFDARHHDRKFLYYLLSTLDLPRFAKGVKPGINRNEVYSQTVRVPSLEEQQHVASLLDDAFEGIATARANAERNVRNARALFDAHVHATFGQRAGCWLETTVDHLSTNLDGKRVPITRAKRTPGDVPYYGASGVVDYVAEHLFEGDTLLVSEDGANLLARSTPIAFSVDGKYWVNNHAHVLRFDDKATQRFVEFYLESIPVDQYVTGAAQPKLTQKALNSIPIPIPVDRGERARIVERLEAVSDEAEQLDTLYARKLAALDELKRSLLHYAFTGKLTARTLAVHAAP